MTIHLHTLKGCSPAPLANYLKALGILRLVSEQADKQARGWWQGGNFCLFTVLSKEEFEKFFLEDYIPTPILAPWNGGSGFFPKDNKKSIDPIKNSTAERMKNFREAITEANSAIKGLKNKPDPKKEKPIVFSHCVKHWRGGLRKWLDAAVVFNDQGKPTFPSILGTAGNDGRLDFTVNYMQHICNLFDLSSAEAKATKDAEFLLKHSLWMDPANKLKSYNIGQFQPGSAGGANSSTGFTDNDNLVNSWDFILMLEGSLLFTAKATRRLDPNEFSRASAPFAVRAHAAGFGTAGSEKSQRGEQWMPLWKQPATLSDVVALYSEARIQIKRQTANRPIDMARAISRLGVARGIDSFIRYGYLERNGQANLAVPLGRINVRHHPRAYLIDDIAGWLDKLNRLSRDQFASSRLIHAERRLADAVLAALTHDYSPERWQAILIAAVSIEALQATGTAIEAGPIPSLRPEWVDAVNDNSPEMRLALSLGSAAAGYSNGKPLDPIRHHWLPLELGCRKFKTNDKRLIKDPRVVISGRNPVSDFSAIVARRFIEAGMKSQRILPLVSLYGCYAQLNDLALFLRGALDLEKILNLSTAFMAIKWDQWSKKHNLPHSKANEIPEEAWLTVRLGCLPWQLTNDKKIPADPRIIRLLNSGDSTRAIGVALSRLRSAGIRPPLQTGVSDVASAKLWAAALVFPINRGSALCAAITLDPSMKGYLNARN